MPAYAPMLEVTYYAQNYAGIIRQWLVLASSLNLVDGIPIDFTHAVLEGVTKWIMRAWFKSENHAQPFYLG